MSKRVVAAFFLLTLTIPLLSTLQIGVMAQQTPKYFFEFNLVGTKGVEFRMRTAEIIATELAKIGIKVNLQFIDHPSTVNRQRSARNTWAEGGVEAFIVEYVGTRLDSDGLHEYFHSPPAGASWTLFKAPYMQELDAALDEGRTIADPQKRQAAYAKVSKILYDEQFVAPIYMPYMSYILKKEIQGFLSSEKGRNHWSVSPISKTGVTPGKEVVVVFAQPNDASHGNGLFGSLSMDKEGIGMAIYDTLLDLDENFKLMPRLAKSWEISNDGLRYTFHLRDDVYWHDGVKFTSADVKWTAEARASQPQAESSGEYQTVDHVETPDDYTAIFVLKQPYSRALVILGGIGGTGFILPAHILKDVAPDKLIQHPFDLHPIGTGPYVFSDWKRDDSITLVKNKNYWGKQGNVDKLVIRVMPEASSALMALQAGEVDILSYQYGFTTQLKEIGSDPRFKVLNFNTLKTGVLGFNNQNPLLSNKYVRWAISLMIPRDRILETVLQGNGESISQFLAKSSMGYNPDLAPIKYDPKLAADYMKKAGYDLQQLKPLEIPPETYVAPTIIGALIGVLVGASVVALLRRKKLRTTS